MGTRKREGTGKIQLNMSKGGAGNVPHHQGNKSGFPSMTKGKRGVVLKPGEPNERTSEGEIWKKSIAGKAKRRASWEWTNKATGPAPTPSICSTKKLWAETKSRP